MFIFTKTYLLVYIIFMGGGLTCLSFHDGSDWKLWVIGIILGSVTGGHIGMLIAKAQHYDDLMRELHGPD